MNLCVFGVTQRELVDWQMVFLSSVEVRIGLDTYWTELGSVILPTV